MSATTTPRALAALHQPFDWIPADLRHRGGADFLSLALDVSQGIETCLALVHTSNLERMHNADADPGSEGQPVLDCRDTERLLRLAMVSAQLLATDAAQRIDRLSNEVRP